MTSLCSLVAMVTIPVAVAAATIFILSEIDPQPLSQHHRTIVQVSAPITRCPTGLTQIENVQLCWIGDVIQVYSMPAARPEVYQNNPLKWEPTPAR